MNIKRIVMASFLSLTIVASGVAYVAPVSAVDEPASDPTLISAMAKNTGGTLVKEAGDSIVINFSESTNKTTIDATNIDEQLELSGGHSFLDGNGEIQDAVWSEDGTSLVVYISDGGSLPTVAVGDTVTYSGEGLTDIDENPVTGNAVIEGTFTAVDDTAECEEESSEEEEVTTSAKKDRFTSNVKVTQKVRNGCDDSGQGKYRCGVGLQNGRLYKVADSPTVYLMAACRLKPFRGAAAFHSRGLKFSDIIVLATLPANITISDKPALPAEGTLIKGSDATVWFMAKNGKRKGFTSSTIFLALGFKFDEVDQITDSDLGTVETDTDLIDDSSEHPDGALIKCGNSGTVFKVIGNLRFPFANLESFQGRGHSFDKILAVDCGRFAYRVGAPITE